MNNRYRNECRIKGPKFSNREVWNIGFVLARHIHKGLLQFKQSKRWGHPGSITEEEWENILDKMIWSFSEIANNHPSDPYNIALDEWEKITRAAGKEIYREFKTKNGLTAYEVNFDITDELKNEMQKYRDKIKEGTELFAKYIEDLWD